ncbi:MAG: FkbM family methyltransferase [Calothrix sp. SM1_7_51]|nr:FkbM family methyltransferase [Calothrix sp. SM1_7_51]
MLNWYLAREVGYLKFFFRYSIRQISKRIFRIDNNIKLKNSIVMKLPRNSCFGTELFLKNGSVDWGSEEYLIKFLDKDKSFLDIGANIGYYSLLLAPYCHSVYAFEPDKRSLQALNKNAAKVNNIQVIQKAVFSQPGEMQLDITRLPELSHLQKKAEILSSSQDSVSVEVTTLDKFANENPKLRVTAIKTDVEGADFDVLLGAKNLIIRDQPLILSEIYPDFKLFEFLKPLDYLIFAFVKPRDRSLIHTQPKFVQITENPQIIRCKMAFLVPRRLHQAFLELVVSG